MSREGSLEAPTRHPVNWKAPEFYDEKSALDEMERVFDICHGCRRCVSLCNAFPTLFDLVDNSPTMEMDGVDRKDYINVVDHCYLCDLSTRRSAAACRSSNWATWIRSNRQCGSIFRSW